MRKKVERVGGRKRKEGRKEGRKGGRYEEGINE
jgi:hypothetical protein